ncbi:hypothetical protein LEP1GSC202_0701 [Leptospira yanagawae serovar Saopaulo str. Sao Paulo = ATCC 700523]|uniref:DUF4345 domain-containing protein n=2 Tax=Leptospira yanagawae TaxID=293069 RepID=A0ABY2LZ14_9LEPT|nr:hypothetical protein [Leptospira yanagawae]EOQ89520.1 hypothetical protein LEP1GSC202_0701 [Leptospira yanagawae serovar Saopaulo str. Sao Paulo = ATCC 700523]TGL17460.1 hypothetical protein EHQ46_16445 [Leptospira yanagawae]
MKKNLIFTIITFLIIAVLETIVNQLLLKETYTSLSQVWRTPNELGTYAPIFLGIYLVFSIAYVFLFTRAYKGEGVLSGIWIGLAIGGIAKFWYGYTNLIVLPIPHELGFLWFLYGTLETMILGGISALYLDGQSSEKKHSKKT